MFDPFLCNGTQGLVRLLIRLWCVWELGVRKFFATDDLLLDLSTKALPGLEIVKVLLCDNVASTRVRGIFASDDSRLGERQTNWIGSTIDKLQQIATVEVSESTDFVLRCNCPFQTLEEHLLERDNQIH
ncbi:hypothetical protein D3C73_1155270 [compost metagenome]